MKDNLILTISTGKNRNFIDVTKPLMERYSIKTNSDFVIIRDDSPILQKLYTNCFTVGRNNNFTYVLKVKLVYYYLEYYQNVLWLDDTCIIKPDTINLFTLMEDKHIVAFNEGSVLEFNSWKYDSNFIRNKMNFDINTDLYINTGVVLYNQGIRQYLADENINKYRILFTSQYPHQAFINYIIQFYNIPIGFLDKVYNQSMVQCNYKDDFNTKNLIIDPKMLIESNDKIYHITGFYKKCRYEIIEQICRIIETHDYNENRNI